MIAGTLMTIREGLEAFLIVGILVGYLTKVKRPEFKVYVWIGTAAALAKEHFAFYGYCSASNSSIFSSS